MATFCMLVCGDLTCFVFSLNEEICQITVQLLFFMSLTNRIVYFLIYFFSIQRLLRVISALSDMQMLMKLTPALEETDTPTASSKEGRGEHISCSKLTCWFIGQYHCRFCVMSTYLSVIVNISSNASRTEIMTKIWNWYIIIIFA